MTIRDQQKTENGRGFLQRYARAFILWGCLIVWYRACGIVRFGFKAMQELVLALST